MKKKSTLYIGLLVNLIPVFVLYIIPFLICILISFCEGLYNFVPKGFVNYSSVLTDNRFLLAAGNNISFIVVGVTLNMALSIAIAFILHRIKFPIYIKVIFLLPLAIPSFSVTGFFRIFFGEAYLNIVGTVATRYTVLLLYLWKSIGINILILTLALYKIDKSVIEASEIDGAGYFRRVVSIMLPLLSRTLTFVLFVSLINSLSVYKDVQLLYGDYPEKGVYMLQHYMNYLYKRFSFNQLSATAIMFLIIFSLFLLVFLFVDKKAYERMGEYD